MATTSTSNEKLLCKRCGHTWKPVFQWDQEPTVDSEGTQLLPKACPSCKSYKWNVDRKPRKEVKPV